VRFVSRSLKQITRVGFAGDEEEKVVWRGLELFEGRVVERRLCV
jgi:hypothetical protein